MRTLNGGRKLAGGMGLAIGLAVTGLNNKPLSTIRRARRRFPGTVSQRRPTAKVV